MSAVELAGIHKRFGDVTALDDVSLTIAHGEFFALLGPSGSGKTTLLRTVAGFLTPDSGQLLIGGADATAVPVNRRDIGMVFQHYALFPHMNVRGNIAFGLDVRRQPRAEIRRRVNEMLELVSLEGLGERRPRELSGGQQQRVAIARALVTEPRVLLLDEPLGALDRRLRQQMQVELRRLQQQVNITTLFVTHDQEEALTLSDRVALLDHGALVQVGTPADVYETPRSRFAAQFLGDANFLDGHVENGHLIAEGGLHIPLDDTLANGTAMTLAVRPEKITLAPVSETSARATGQPALAGTVSAVVYAGNSVTYRIRASALPANAAELTVYEQNRAGTPLAVGTPVQCSWHPRHSIVLAP